VDSPDVASDNDVYVRIVINAGVPLATEEAPIWWDRSFLKCGHQGGHVGIVDVDAFLSPEVG